MPKKLEGYVGDEVGAPIEGVQATVTRVSDGFPVALGATGPDGYWSFADLDETQEHHVRLVDTPTGRSSVRGPWSGEMRETYVRDRLSAPLNTSVAGLPLTISPDSNNTLQWRASGLYVPRAVAPITLSASVPDDPVLIATFAGSPIPRYVIDAMGGMQWSDGLAWDTILTRDAPGTLVLNGSPLLTQAAGDARYLTPAAGDALFLTQTEGDARYEPFDSAYTKAETDTRYVNTSGDTMSGTLNLSSGSINIDNGSLYTADGIMTMGMLESLIPAGTNAIDIGIDSESNSRLRVRADGRISWGGGAIAPDTFLERTAVGVLSMNSKPFAISPDAANIIEWRSNGWYAAAGAVADIWVNTTGDTMTGALAIKPVGHGGVLNTGLAAGLNHCFSIATTGQMDWGDGTAAQEIRLMRADVNEMRLSASWLPMTTNLYNLGHTSLRWSKLWAATIDLSGVISATARGHLFGGIGSTGIGAAVATGDASILMYNSSATNWSGMGIDPSGNWWVRAANTTSYPPNLSVMASGELRLNSTNDSTVNPTLSIYKAMAGTGGGARINIYTSRNTTLVPNANAANDELWRMTIHGRGGTAYAAGATIDSTVMAAAANIIQACVSLRTADAAGALVERMRVDHTGRVIINPLTDPGFPYDDGIPGLTTLLEGGSVFGGQVYGLAYAGAVAPRQYWLRTRGTWASKVAVADGDYAMSIEGWGWSGSQWLISSAIRSVTSGVVTTTAVPGMLAFSTSDTTGALLDRLKIANNGTVIVGTSTPLAWDAPRNAIQLGQAAAIVGINTFSQLEMRENTYADGSNNRAVVTGASSQLRLSSGTFVFYTAPSVAAGAVQTLTPALAIASDGKIGIGAKAATGAISWMEVQSLNSGVSSIRAIGHASIPLGIPILQATTSADTTVLGFGSDCLVGGNAHVAKATLGSYTGTGILVRNIAGAVLGYIPLYNSS